MTEKEENLPVLSEIIIDNQVLSLEKLIERADLLTKLDNPYLVANEIENIKSIFYTKLNIEKKKTQPSLKEQNKNPKEENNNYISSLEIKFKTTLESYRKIKSVFRKAKAKQEKENLNIKRNIIEEIKTLTEEEESMKITFEKFRNLQKKWKNTGHVPIVESNHIWQSYQHNVERFYDFIKINNELRDLDFKRNLEAKNTICEKANSLLKEKSIKKMHSHLQELHEEWKNIGPVEKELREDLWEKFQKITKILNKKRNDFFIKIKQEDTLKLNKKELICKKIDSLITKTGINTHRDWQKASNKCQELESQWKTIGRLGNEKNKIAWKSFRNSLSNFYETRQEFYKQKKETEKQIIKNKLIICEKAEKIKNNTNWKKTEKELISLQKEWEKSGFSNKKEAQKIWEKFKSACDIFFKAKRVHHKETLKKQEKLYQEKEKTLHQLEKFTPGSKSEKDIEVLKQFNIKWSKIGPTYEKDQDIDKKFTKMLESKFNDLGINGDELDIEKYKNKLDILKSDRESIRNERKVLNKQIDKLKKELQQYENNISFFSNSKSSEVLLNQVQKNVENIKDNIRKIKQKIQLLNKA